MAKKILLAEDSLTIRKVFELTFAQTDVALTMVDNGSDAVRLAGEYAPDLVVADVTLPGKDGFDVAAELRESEKTRMLPVLILSGTLSPFDEEKFKRSGASGVLFKPFESQELIDKVQELFKGRETAAPGAREEAAPAADEPWDFSDVLEEVEDEAGRTAGVSVSPRGEDLLPGATVSPAKAEGRLALGEFDVSLEEIEEPPAAEDESAPPAEHMEEEGFTDAPVAVTDLTPAIEAVEEFEEIEDLEEMELLQKESEAAPPPASPPAAPERPLPPEEPPLAPSVPAAPESALREQFAARAQEIFERVAAETVEKVLWEYMDRFSAEFSAKVRESVEAVAWEVIPATAEALIREEISRIRAETEKKSP
ncbi:MAG: response regulator [Deltaproteobacteria bacterium]|nr:response regulator [Deltaproteobacteria bacterium]